MAESGKVRRLDQEFGRHAMAVEHEGEARCTTSWLARTLCGSQNMFRAIDGLKIMLRLRPAVLPRRLRVREVSQVSHQVSHAKTLIRHDKSRKTTLETRETLGASLYARARARVVVCVCRMCLKCLKCIYVYEKTWKFVRHLMRQRATLVSWPRRPVDPGATKILGRA